MAHHPEVTTDQERRAAWAAAKLAARLYARDPSRQNESRVRSAWQRLREVTDRSVDLRSTRTLAGLVARFHAHEAVERRVASEGP